MQRIRAEVAPDQTTAEIHQGLQLIQAKYFLDELQGLLIKEEAETHTWLIKAKLGQYEVNQKVERQPSKATKEAEVNDADRAKHEAMAKEIEAKLKAITAQDGEVFADFYTRIKTEAAKLQTLYQPQLREGIVLSIELMNSVKEDEKDGDVDVRVRIRPNDTKARFNILFTDENVDDVLDHIRKVDTSVARKKGIGGCHNLEEWNKLRQASAADPIPVGKLITDSSVPEVLIISNTAHPSVPGVSIVQYAVPAIDGKVSDPTGNTIGKTTGAIKIIPNPKTLYDPLLWTDEALRKALMEAVVSRMDANNQLPLENILSGTTLGGYQIRFAVRDGRIDTFWFA